MKRRIRYTVDLRMAMAFEVRLAVLIAEIIQVILGYAKAGALSAFFPSNVIKGLLAAIGVILIIKQTPYLLGYDMVPKTASHGHSNILNQIAKIFTREIDWGALVIGLLSMAFLILSDKIKAMKNSLVPAPLVVVLLEVAIGSGFQKMGSPWILAGGPRYSTCWFLNLPNKGFLLHCK